jgi:hypothetical protein
LTTSPWVIATLISPGAATFVPPAYSEKENP